MPILKINNKIESTDKNIEDLSIDLSGIRDVLTTFISNYKENYDIYCKEYESLKNKYESLENKYESLENEYKILNSLIYKFVKEQLYINKISELSSDLNYLTGNLNAAIVLAEFNEVNKLPWYKKIFKKNILKAASNAAIKVLGEKKPEIDKKRKDLINLIEELQNWEKSEKEQK